MIFVFWEFNQKEPIVDLPLFRNRNFLLTNVLMFALGFALFGGVVLLPLYVQTILGYTATDAGLVITPGGFVIMALMPIVGMLLSKIDAKWLIAFGFTISAMSLFHLSHINAEISYPDAAWARVYQAIGLAFLFVPINTAAYTGLPPGKSSNASALLNVSRNLGGSFGISFVTTMLARRQQFHQSRLIEGISPFNLSTGNTLDAIKNAIPTFDDGSALSQLYGQVQQAATTLSFLDCFWLLGIACLVALPLVLLMKRNRPSSAPAH